MFSEDEIVDQCRHCKGRCDEIIKCPLKSELPAEKGLGIFPSTPCSWKLSYTGKHLYMPAGDRYTTEELIKGLGKLNSHL